MPAPLWNFSPVFANARLWEARTAHGARLSAALTGILVASTLGLINAPPLSAAPATSALPCGEVNVIGLAGSGELDPGAGKAGTDHLGQVVTDFSNKLEDSYAGTGITYTRHGIAYRAISAADTTNFRSLRDDPRAYDNSKLDGQVKLQTYVNRLAVDCPDGVMVLAGYSQGAQAVVDAYALLGPLQNRVAGIALFGDPLFNPGLSPMDQGSFLPPGHGLFGTRPDPGQAFQAKTRSFCLFGDPICNSPTTIPETLACVLSVGYKNIALCEEAAALVECDAELKSKISGICQHYKYRLGSTADAARFIRNTVPPLDHIAVSPGSASIKLGSSQSYAVQGFDVRNHSLGDVTLSTTFTMSPEGYCVMAVCTPTAAGVHTVTGVSAGKTSAVTLSVDYTRQGAGDVVYTIRESDGRSTIWIRHAADGSSEPLTHQDARSPDVSPDGTKIAYIAPDSNPDTPTYITWVMNTDGTDPAPLDSQTSTTDQYSDNSPRWSPDGRQISIGRSYAFNQGGLNGNGFNDVFILNASSGAESIVSADHQSSGPASWSPDGKRLAYYSIPSGVTIADKDGSNIRALDTTEPRQFNPEWAPTGDRIYVDTDVAGLRFFSSSDGFTSSISIPSQSLMPGVPFRDYYPRVSTDGSTIVFAGFDRCPDLTKGCEGVFNLYSVSSTPGGIPTLITSTAGGFEPSVVKP